MAFILKVMHSYEGSPVPSDNEFSVHADLTSINFRRLPNGQAEALCYMREPIKTAEVPGFHEVEKCFVFSATAYVMNEAGKTVASFTAHTSGDPRGPNARAIGRAVGPNGSEGLDNAA